MTRHKHHSEPLNLNWHSSLGIETRIIIGHGTLNKLCDLLSQIHAGNKVLIVKPPDLFTQEIEKIKANIHSKGMSAHILEIPGGESGKSADYLTTIWSILHEMHFSRQDTLVAVGGGSITDVAGFAASTYMRGINLITIPTTLLAQIDAAVGGKTAINFQNTKNMVGSFYFGKATIIDIDTLSTLPKNQFISGWAEIIKYGLLEKTIAAETEYSPGPKPLLAVIEEMIDDLSWDNILLPGIIAAGVKMKLAVVGKDPLESGLRRSLNLGHTLGHALEGASNFQLTHGQSVAIGMAFAFRLAVCRSQINEADEKKAIALIERSTLPTQIPTGIKSETILEAMFHDKKRAAEGIKMVLPENTLGEVNYKDILKRKEIEEIFSVFYQGTNSISGCH